MLNYQGGDQIDYRDGDDERTGTVIGFVRGDAAEVLGWHVYTEGFGIREVAADSLIELAENDLAAVTSDSVRLRRSETHTGMSVSVRTDAGGTYRGHLVEWTASRVLLTLFDEEGPHPATVVQVQRPEGEGLFQLSTLRITGVYRIGQSEALS